MPVGRCHDIVALLSRARLGSVTMPWHFPTGISKLSQGYLTRAVGWSSIARVTLSSSKHAECEQCFGTPKMNSRAGVLQRRLSQSYLTGVERLDGARDGEAAGRGTICTSGPGRQRAVVHVVPSLERDVRVSHDTARRLGLERRWPFWWSRSHSQSRAQGP